MPRAAAPNLKCANLFFAKMERWGYFTLMRAKKQLEFQQLRKPKDDFGGSLLKGNPKGKRPLDSKLPILLTLRSVQGGMRLPKAFGKVEASVKRCAHKYGVRIYEWSNVGNHIHLLIKLPKRQAWAAFIRELTGEIASRMKEQFRTKGKFWMYRPHTRIVQGWRKAYQIAKSYVQLNELEAQGLTNRKELAHLKQLKEIMSSA